MAQLHWNSGIVLAVLGAITGCGSTDERSSSVGETAEIGAELTACEEHLDCTLVETACNACCSTGAIAIDRREAFRQVFDDTCRGYRGGVCDCAPPDVVARCYQGECVATPRADVTECFSPTREASKAFEDDGVGCVCKGDEPRACTSEGALECTSMPTGTLAWRGVEDTSCVPGEVGDAGDAGDERR